nr:hypothetical protein [Acidobacteriota bacterium]
FGTDITKLLADPQHPGTLYAADSQALFKTIDGGAHWLPMPSQGLGGVLDLAVAAQRLFAVGDFRPFPFDPPPCGGSGLAGLVWSDDGGATFSNSLGNRFPFPYSALAADPANPLRVVAGKAGAPQILLSDDGGVTWTSLPALPDLPVPEARHLVLRFDPMTTPSTLFVSAGGTDLADQEVFRTSSLPGGSANDPFWTRITAGLPPGVRVSDLLVDPVAGRLYAATDTGVFGSNDRGDSWSASGTGLDSRAVTVLALDPRPRGPLYAGTASGVYALDRGGCRSADAAACLNGSRFEVTVAYQLANGQTGAGHSRPLTGDTTAFWFFAPDNLELLVKVLDGRAVNGDFWVFSGGLSDVQYTLSVTDVLTGAVKTYPKPAGRLASFADTSAFRGSGAGAGVVVPGGAPVPPADTGCSAGTTGLCLASRFRVEVAFDTLIVAGSGQGVPLTDDTGAFWFLSASNLELLVKVLDGRAVNGHFWVFHGALSDFHYTLTVTDTVTGAVRVYDNPAGHLASAADTAAF